MWARSPTPPQAKPKQESVNASLSSSKSAHANDNQRNDRQAVRPSSSESSSDESSSGSESEERKKKSKSHKKHKSNKKEKKHKKDKDKKKRKERDQEDRDHHSKKSKSSPVTLNLSAAKYVDPLTVNPFAADIEKLRNDVKASSHPHPARAESDDEEVGPAPMINPKDLLDKKISYGDQMLPGEGAAIAQYVQQNLRIPRRGEIGWSGEEIETLEKQGYVMSGSRHAVMNAVRLRKENQVYSAEEKRALAFINIEQKQQKDDKIIGDFRAMLTKRLADAGIDQNPNSVKTDEDR